MVYWLSWLVVATTEDNRRYTNISKSLHSSNIRKIQNVKIQTKIDSTFYWDFLIFEQKPKDKGREEGNKKKIQTIKYLNCDYSYK